MSSAIAPTDWPSNMSAEDRKVWMRSQILDWVSVKKIDDALSTAELGNLSYTQKAVAYRSLLIIGSIRHCRANKRAEARIPILTLITYLSDNGKGICSLTITRMMELFSRTRQCIVDNIEALEVGGMIGVARVDGLPNVYWPRIPAALGEINPNPVWFVDALSTTPKSRIFGNVDDAIAAAASRSSPVDQSSVVDRYPSSGVDTHQSSSAGGPVYSNQGTGLFEHDSISSLYLKEGKDRSGLGATQKTSLGSKPEDQMLAALNPDAAARKAFAKANVTVSLSGKVMIGSEYRAQLEAEGFTAKQIESGLTVAPKYIEGTDPEKWMKTVRTAIGWAKTSAPKGGQSGRPNDFRF